MKNKKFSFHLQNASAGVDVPKKTAFSRWARCALENEAGGEVTLRLVDEAEARQLNSDYRGKDYATNVLSFSYEKELNGAITGDLVLCPSVIEKEAVAQNKALDAHYAHLTVHGFLHLQGYDHDTEEDAAMMESREIEILAGLGFADPYADFCADSFTAVS